MLAGTLSRVSGPSQDVAVELTIELENKLLRRLVAEWEGFNHVYFKAAMRKPILHLSASTTRLGQWYGVQRSLELSRTFVLTQPWPQVLEVLKHEMAHQFVDECLGGEEPAHGPMFVRVCQQLGIDARATGMPMASAHDDDGAMKALDRVRKLLALAQSPNQHEAEAAAMAARRLMLKFNIESDAGARATTRAQYGVRHVGVPTGRVLEHDRRLALILVKYFFVEGLWLSVYRPLEGKRGSVFEICGLEANLMMAEHVHAFLVATAQRLWLDYKHSGKGSSNSDRQAFLAGVMRGFEATLEAQHKQLEAQGLVWVPSPDLGKYVRKRHPQISYVTRSAAQRNEAFNHGHRAGSELVLSQPMTSGSSTNTRPKALRAGD